VIRSRMSIKKVIDYESRSRIDSVIMSKSVPAELREYLAKLGRKGGKKGGPARAAAMTAQQRSESARKAVTARWKKAKEN
jgi:hypothetical protein